MSDALDRLAELAGIEPGYHDLVGQWHHTSTAAKLALLAAMRIDSDAVEAEIARLAVLPGDEAGAQRCLVFVEIPGQHQRHRNLHDFRRLDAGEAERQPAPGTIDLDPEQEDRNQQQETNDVQRNGEAHQLLRRQASDEPHDDQRDAHVGCLRHHAMRAVVGCRIHGAQADRHDRGGDK